MPEALKIQKALLSSSTMKEIKNRKKIEFPLFSLRKEQWEIPQFDTCIGD